MRVSNPDEYFLYSMAVQTGPGAYDLCCKRGKEW